MPAVWTQLSVLLALLIGVIMPTVHANVAPAAGPMQANDGVAVDQCIAYVLMFAALVVTYLIHPLDASGYTIF
ncbi:hypothetical protein O6H91_14G065200 [Diphasiastrum complanatum]|uniref:Uncharacterized protein n=1 Tax=Diphasiastrum complanatum TaxID=34168 RepID=A0ACC2BQD8_DIPCM|nr:hypothetical protein O6H91_14G065200 [Diphasiastrum complanatum]